jgi:glycosyltransferase involved in cell wall biosynthesis
MPKALDIFNRSADLKTIYYLGQLSDGAMVTPNEAEAGHFLLWASVFGRKLYHGIVIDPDYFDYITEPVGEYLTRVELFATMRQRPGSDRGQAKTSNSQAEMLAAHHWYYGSGIAELNLEIFATPRELAVFASICALDGESRFGPAKQVLDALNRLSEGVADTSPKQKSTLTGQSTGADEIADPPLWLSMRLEAKATRPVGVNLIGYANGVLGIGEDIRATARALGNGGIPFSILNVALPEAITPSQTTDLTGFFVDRPIFPVNVFCMTLFETERMRMEIGSDMFRGRYNIGYWPWELPALPSVWHHAFDHLDEIWALSPYLVEVFSRYTDKPVILMPPGVAIGPVEPFDLGTLGIEPGTFVFLTMLDFNSFMSRKNPIGTVDAFKQAFPRQKSAERLIIKTINGDTHADEFDRLLAHVGSDPRIIVVDGTYSRAATNGLISAADCLVSLHRAEGLGRTIAEAMLLGTPVVATDWSGSTALIDDSTGFPVAYKLVPIPSGDYIGGDGCRWAEPLVEAAAKQFRLVRKEPDLAKQKCAAAKLRIVREHGPGAVAARLAARLDQIAARWRPVKQSTGAGGKGLRGKRKRERRL